MGTKIRTLIRSLITEVEDTDTINDFNLLVKGLNNNNYEEANKIADKINNEESIHIINSKITTTGDAPRKIINKIKLDDIKKYEDLTSFIKLFKGIKEPVVKQAPVQKVAQPVQQTTKPAAPVQQKPMQR